MLLRISYGSIVPPKHHCELYYCVLEKPRLRSPRRAQRGPSPTQIALAGAAKPKSDPDWLGRARRGPRPTQITLAGPARPRSPGTGSASQIVLACPARPKSDSERPGGPGQPKSDPDPPGRARRGPSPTPAARTASNHPCQSIAVFGSLWVTYPGLVPKLVLAGPAPPTHPNMPQPCPAP